MPIQWLTLCGLLTLAVWHDWHHRRIPNRLLAVFALAGMGISLLPGGIGLLSALGAAMLGAGAFAPLYLVRKMGGGDIKLMATTGLLVGADRMASLCLAVALSGGVLAMVWWWHLRRAIKAGPDTANSKRMEQRLPYALAIAAGTLVQGLSVTLPAHSF